MLTITSYCIQLFHCLYSGEVLCSCFHTGNQTQRKFAHDKTIHVQLSRFLLVFLGFHCDLILTQCLVTNTMCYCISVTCIAHKATLVLRCVSAECLGKLHLWDSIRWACPVKHCGLKTSSLLLSYKAALAALAALREGRNA